MSKWQTYKLKDVTTKIGSGATPTGGSGAYKTEGISLIRSQNVLDYKFTEDGLAFIDDNQAYALRNVIVEANDVLLNITGDSVARCCGVPIDWLPARVNQHVAILRSNPEILDNRFLKYSLLASKEELLILSEIGGTRNALTKGMLEDYEVSLPSLSEQKTIASVLSSLDDKIDLLHRQNKTLEDMAETLFRQWFIEEAKEDWAEKPLEQIVSHFIDYRGKTPNKTSSGIPLITAKIVKGGRIQKPTEFISEEDYPLWMTRGYPELNDVVLTTEAPLGEIGLIRDTRVALAQRIITLRCHPNIFDNVLLKYYLMSEIGQYELDSRASGTTVFGIKASVLKKLSLTIPPLDEQKEIVSKLHAIEDKMYSNEQQTRILENLRDTLLPKLMSGEVRVEYKKVDAA